MDLQQAKFGSQVKEKPLTCKSLKKEKALLLYRGFTIIVILLAHFDGWSRVIEYIWC
jgi:hypothetical protein